MLSRLLRAKRVIPTGRALRRRFFKMLQPSWKKRRQAFSSRRFNFTIQIQEALCQLACTRSIDGEWRGPLLNNAAGHFKQRHATNLIRSARLRRNHDSAGPGRRCGRDHPAVAVLGIQARAEVAEEDCRCTHDCDDYGHDYGHQAAPVYDLIVHLSVCQSVASRTLRWACRGPDRIDRRK
jgi:hypothetical protein